MTAGEASMGDAFSYDGSTPLWFKPEKFLDPEFNAEQYVQDLQRYVPLDSIGDELGRHLQTLQDRLVEVVNQDYMNFVNLSTNLVDVDSAIKRMEGPVMSVKAEIEQARAGVAAKAAQLQDGLARRKAAASNRALLELAQDAAHVLSKVEKLLQEVPHSISTTAPDIDELEARCRLLDRICSEVSRLNFYIAKGEGVPLLKQMEPQGAAATHRLQLALDAALRSTLHGQNPAALGMLLHAYTSLGRAHLAEQIVLEEVVAPIVQDAAKDATDVTVLFTSITAALKEGAAGFLEYVMSPAAGSQAFDFLGGSILPAIVLVLEKQVPTAFSPGFPDAFSANYKQTMKLLTTLEGYAVTTEQVQRFRSSEAYTALLAKWNLAAYFSLRFRDIAGGVEDQLATAGLAPSPKSTSTEETPAPVFFYAATAAVWAALQDCIKEGVFLPPLADRFLRLVLQLLARYGTWIQKGLEEAAAATDGANGTPKSPWPPQEEEATNTASWAAGASAEQLSSLWRDVELLNNAVESQFLPLFKQAVGLTTVDDAIHAAFSDARQGLDTAAGIALQSTAHALADKCCGALKQLRGIVATFRMANRSAPTRPSHYVVTILAPLGQFLQSNGQLQGSTKQTLTKAVAEGVSEKYQQLADDTLKTVRKTEDSLRRLKSRKTATAGEADEGAASAMDTDKLIAAQLVLDVEEYAVQLKKLGINANESEAYKLLWKTVSPDQQ